MVVSDHAHSHVDKTTTSAIQTRGGVEDTRLEAKAKETKKVQGQGQTLSRSSTGMLEKDAGAVILKKKGSSKKFFKRSQKKIFKKIFQAFSERGQLKRDLKIFRKIFGVFHQNFNGSKNSAVLEPEDRTIYEDFRL